MKRFNNRPRRLLRVTSKIIFIIFITAVFCCEAYGIHEQSIDNEFMDGYGGNQPGITTTEPPQPTTTEPAIPVLSTEPTSAPTQQVYKPTEPVTQRPGADNPSDFDNIGDNSPPYNNQNYPDNLANPTDISSNTGSTDAPGDLDSLYDNSPPYDNQNYTEDGQIQGYYNTVKNPPKTGDEESDPRLWLITLAVSAFILRYVLFFRKYQNN
ncbi:MAG: hypothetical protein FWD71_15660, partial [Oscillospiraceae bacterium]|nr:hypothetical protein [Oscillospiraceae bacterium]